MARVSSFVFCDQIRTDITPNGPVRNIISPLIELRPINIPGNYSFAIACTISEYNPKQENHFVVNLLDPSGKTEMILKADIPPAVENMPVPTTVNLDIDQRNTVFSQEGEFTVEIILNDEILTSQKLTVRKKGTLC